MISYEEKATSHPGAVRAIRIDGIRSFILIHLDRISDSCGFGVPVLEFKHYRKQLRTYNERNGEEKLADYKIIHNTTSIDDLPGVKTR